MPDHPSIASVLAHVAGDSPSAELAEHLAGCAACRALAGLGDPFGERALVELIAVEPALYGRREALRDAHSGMGRAYRAWDRRIGREVVIKEIRPVAGLSVEAQRARFEREARVTARLQHPGIVAVLELGRWPDGEPFYTMPLVEGEPLDEAIARAATADDRLALLPRVAAAAEAIAYAHDRGVVHRDVKPANVLLGRFGETVVIDWGLAKPLGEAGDLPAAPLGGDDGLTRFGAGTPSYMPPEQARGDEPDRRVDVYALGATLYHLLAGVPPYGPGHGETIRRRLLAGPPPPLAEVAPDAPPALVAIVDKAMARDPDARFAAALELAEELRRYTTGQLIRSHQYRPGELLEHWLRRYKVAVRVALVGALVVAAVAIVSVSRIVRARDRARAERTRAEASERAARAALAASQVAHGRVLAGQPTTRLDALALAADALADGVGAAVDWPSLVDTLTAGPVAVALPRDTINQAMQAPRGDRFATIGRDGVVELWDRDVRPLGAHRSAIARPHWLAWARDAAHVAVFGVEPRVEIVDADGRGSRVLDLGGEPDGRAQVAFTAGGLVATARHGALALWDPATGARRAEVAVSCQPDKLVSAGALVVASCADGALVAWDGGAAVRTWPVHGGQAAVTVAADERTVYSAGDDGRALAWSAEAIAAWLRGGPAPEPRVLLADAGTRVYVVLPWPDGRTVTVGYGASLIIGEADGVRMIDPYRSYELAPTPGAARLFGTEGGLDVVAVDPGSREVIVRLQGHERFATTVLAATADGERVLSVTSVGEAWLWEARLGVTAGALPVHDGEVVAVAIDAGAGAALVASVDGLVRAVALADGAVRWSVRAGTEVVAAATGAGRLVTGHRDGRVRVWSAAGRLERTHATGTVALDAVAVDAVGVVIAHRADGTAVRIDPAGTAADVTAARPPLARSPAGAVVVADADGRIAIRAPGAAGAAGERVVAAGGSAVLAATYAPGDRLITGHASGAVAVWDVAAATSWTVPAHGHGPATALAATPDGRWLVIGHADGAVRVAPLDLDAARDQLCARLVSFGRTAGPCAITAAAGPARR